MMGDGGRSGCAIRWMADEGDAQSDGWRGSGVPPARRVWCRGESRHATLRFAYRVTEECRRSATRECKPSDDVSTTALRRFLPMAVYCAVGAIRWVMADEGDAQSDGWRGSGVPPARRVWCRGESRHATLRFAYRVTEECRRSATRGCKPRDDVSTTALRR